MNSIQESKRSMFLVVEEFINNSDSTVLAAMPNFETLFEDFQRGLSDLRVSSEKQIYSRLGYQMEKAEQRLVMADLCLNISGRVRAYASNINDPVLFEQMNRKRNAVLKLNDTLILDYCQQVHDKTETLLADLVTYGIVAADLQTFQDSIDNYLDLIPKPRFEIVNRKQATREVAESIAYCDEQLRLMDILVTMLEFSNTSFFINYFDNRKLVNTGSRAISFRGTVTDAEGALLQGVKVIIASLGLEKITTAKGNFEMKHVPPGVYTAIFEKEGMITFTAPIAISANQRTDLDVTLERIDSMRSVS